MTISNTCRTILSMKTEERILELLSETLSCRFDKAWEFHSADPGFSIWFAYPRTVVTVLLRGEIKTSIRGRAELTHWHEGEVLCLRPNMQRMHRVVSNYEVRYQGVGVDFEMLNKGIDVLSFFDVPALFSEAKAERIAKTIGELYASMDASPSLKRSLRRNALCSELLFLLVENAGIQPMAMRRLEGLSRLSDVLSHLIRRWDEEPDIALLSRKCSLSRSRFHAVFKEATGESPYEFVRHIRLEKASAILLASDLDVAEIGQRLGWNDQFHFSRVFKAAFGISPRNYRNLHRSNCAPILA